MVKWSVLLNVKNVDFHLIIHVRKIIRTACLILFIIFIVINKYSAIDSAKPEYNYNEFLIQEFSTTEILPLESKKISKRNFISFLQGYSIGNYIFSYVSYQDSLLTINSGSMYKQDLLHGYLSINNYNHSVNYNYHDYPHKNNLSLNILEFNNSFTLLCDDDKGSLFFDNSLEYIHHNRSNNEVDLSGLKNRISLSWQLRNNLISGTIILPRLHDNRHYQIISNYMLGEKVVSDDYRMKTYLYGIGISFVDLDNMSVFPTLLFRFTHHNIVLLQLQLKETVVDYPINSYFNRHNLLWNSYLPLDEDHNKPHTQQQLVFKTELRTGSFYQDVSLNYSYSKNRYEYMWDYYETHNSYSIGLKDKEAKTLSFKYSANYNYSSISFTGIFFHKSDFVPFVNITLSNRYNLNVYNSLLFRFGYNLHETIHLREIDYMTISLSYAFSKVDDKVFEIGISYSSLASESMYWDNSTAIWFNLVLDSLL